MAIPSNSSSVQDIIQQLENSLDVAIQQLTEGSGRYGTNFDLDTFWSNFIKTTELLSHEATKFAMAFEDPDTLRPEACQSLVDKLERTSIAFLAIFMCLPKAQGKLLHQEISSYVTQLLTAIKNLCSSARNRSPNYLQIIGDIWKQCENVTSLPKENKEAVLKMCKEQLDLVQDALQELVQAMDNEEDGGFELNFMSPLNGARSSNVQSWSDSDRKVLGPATGLLKATKACVKKTKQAVSARGDAGNERSIRELDNTAELIFKSSALVDELVLSLYPPMDHPTTRERALTLKNNLKELLVVVRSSHFSSDEDETWLRFLDNAVDHNWGKVNDLALTE